MQTITQTIYEFHELSEKSKKAALSNYAEIMQNNFEIDYYIFDNCYLFEPKHDILISMFGEEYGNMIVPIIDNNRKNICFYEYYGLSLQIENAIVINNENLFLSYLQIPIELQNKVYYTFQSNRKNNTTIEFKENEFNYEFTYIQLTILENASAIFNDHINQIAKDIEKSIDFYFSEQNTIETIKDNEVLFFDNGKIYN